MFQLKPIGEVLKKVLGLFQVRPRDGSKSNHLEHNRSLKTDKLRFKSGEAIEALMACLKRWSLPTEFTAKDIYDQSEHDSDSSFSCYTLNSFHKLLRDAARAEHITLVAKGRSSPKGGSVYRQGPPPAGHTHMSYVTSDHIIQVLKARPSAEGLSTEEIHAGLIRQRDYVFKHTDRKSQIDTTRSVIMYLCQEGLIKKDKVSGQRRYRLNLDFPNEETPSPAPPTAEATPDKTSGRGVLMAAKIHRIDRARLKQQDAERRQHPTQDSSDVPECVDFYIQGTLFSVLVSARNGGGMCRTPMAFGPTQRDIFKVLVEQLDRLSPKHQITIEHDSEYLQYLNKTRFSRWESMNWTTEEGKPLCNIDLLKQLYAHFNRLEIKMIYRRAFKGKSVA